MTQRVYFEKGEQTLVHVPHRAGASVLVASGTYQIVDTRYSIDADEHVIVVAGTAATVDATSTALTAAAGRNAQDRRALSLASTAALVVGSQYRLEAATGQAELVTIAAVTSATLARTTRETRGEYPTGSTLRGVECRALFPAGPAADEDNLDAEAWIVVWTFPGMPPIREPINLERGEEAQLATLDDLARLDPTISIVGGERYDAAAALATAHQDFRADLSMSGASEADVLTGPLGREAVKYRAAHLVMSHDDNPISERKAAAYQARYQEIRAALIVGSKKPGVVSLDKATQQARTSNPSQLFGCFGYRGPTT